MKIRNCLFLLLLAVCFSTNVFSQKIDLTGTWDCTSGGTYYIRHEGDKIFWYGENAKSGGANVAYGTIKEDEIKLDWADVPKSSFKNIGILILKVESEKKITTKDFTGNFGKKEWTKKK